MIRRIGVIPGAIAARLKKQYHQQKGKRESPHRILLFENSHIYTGQATEKQAMLLVKSKFVKSAVKTKQANL